MNSSQLTDARALVQHWSDEFGHPWTSLGMQITLTDLVKERMAAEVTALVTAALEHERCQHPPTTRFRDQAY